MKYDAKAAIRAISIGRDVCEVMKEHCENVLAGEDEPGAGKAFDEILLEKCNEYIQWANEILPKN